MAQSNCTDHDGMPRGAGVEAGLSIPAAESSSSNNECKDDNAQEAQNRCGSNTSNAPQDTNISDRRNDQDETTQGDLETAMSRVSTTDELYSIFTKPQRIMIVVIATFAGFISPLSANTYFPAIPSIASSLGVTIGNVNLTLTTYMVLQAIAPMFVGAFADSMGRRPAYIITITIYLAANVGLALQNNYVALLILRCLQSTGCSGTIALTYAVAADVSSSSERGTYIGWATSGLMLGPAVGPIIGGILSQYLGWHSIFWFLAIAALCALLVSLVLLPETCRNVVGNGSIPPPIWGFSVITYMQQRRIRKLDALNNTNLAQAARRKKEDFARRNKVHFPNPLKTIAIVLEKDAGLLLFNNSFIFTSFFCVIASLPELMRETYGFDDLRIGLSFIPFGVGCALSAILTGRLMDWNFRRIARKRGLDASRERGNDIRRFPIERARLQCALPPLYLGICFIIIHGWLFQFRVHYIAPLVLLFFQGLTMNGAFTTLNTFLVDLYPQSPATATSANNFVRCLVGAGGTALISQMIAAMGRGWCFTFIALVVALWSPGLWVIMKYGPKWREERYTRNEKEEKEKQVRRERQGGHEMDLRSTSEHEPEIREEGQRKSATGNEKNEDGLDVEPKD